MPLPYLSGFTFVKHGLSLGYPVKESILSISPICDEVVINVGFGDPNLEKDDGTYSYLRDSLTDKKYVWVKSFWDPNKTSQGLILSEQTNIALAKVSGKYAQYIQADEAVHEEDHSIILGDIKKLENHPLAHGLVYNYVHFYGNTDVIKHTRNIYRKELRLFKNHLGIKSHLDAQGFRTQDNQKVLCLESKAKIYHYGWARKENIMANKVKVMDRLYHGKDYDSKDFTFKKIWGLKKFSGTHPAVMRDWIAKNKNDIDVLNLPLDFREHACLRIK